ncbi:MAG: transglycosylase family protein [Actinomycetota bacterium]|jgi:hypothetical protein|nr:transglycosylase family protein [Actinomycetota bacterium]
MRIRIALASVLPVAMVTSVTPTVMSDGAAHAASRTPPSTIEARTIALVETEAAQQVLTADTTADGPDTAAVYLAAHATNPAMLTMANLTRFGETLQRVADASLVVSVSPPALSTGSSPTSPAATATPAPASPPPAPASPPPAPAPVTNATSTNTPDWQCIRIHESSDRYNSPAAPSGAYGIVPVTWHSFGYSGWPYQAAPAVQDALALRLYNMYGWQPWSTRFACGL